MNQCPTHPRAVCLTTMDSSGSSAERSRPKRRREEVFGDQVSEDDNMDLPHYDDTHHSKQIPQRDLDAEAIAAGYDPIAVARERDRLLGGGLNMLDEDALRTEALAAGYDPNAVARERSRLASGASNMLSNDMLRMLEGYHSSDGLTSSASSARPTQRRLRRNIDPSSEEGSAMESDIENVVPNPSAPLHTIAGFARPVTDAQAFFEELVQLPPIANNEALQNLADQHRPTRYAASKGRNYRDGQTSSSNSNGNAKKPWEESRAEPVDPDNYNHFIAGQRDNLLLFDGERISITQAATALQDLRKLHKHYQKKLLRPREPTEAQVSELDGKRLIEKTAGASFLLLVALVRSVNFSELVTGGVLASHPTALPTDPPISTYQRTVERIAREQSMDIASSQGSANRDATDAQRLVNPQEPISLSMFESAVSAEKKRLKAVWDKLVNRSPPGFTAEHRQEANLYWGELTVWLDSCLSIVSSFYRIRFIDANTIGRLVSEMSASEAECIQKDEKLKFKLFLSRKMSSLNFRRGPTKGWIYREHFIDGAIPSNFWVKDRKLQDFIIEIVSPINGPEIMPIHAYASDRIPSLVQMVDTGDTSLFPVVCPQRGLFGFRNGIFDCTVFKFYKIGTKAYKDNVTNSVEYKYVYNFFNGVFNDDGFSDADGSFDWTHRLAPYDEDGKPDWANPTRMPPKHWSRNLTVPILDYNIKIQKWDLHTIQNLWFAFGRLLHSIDDNLQFAPFLKGNPGTGKSTFLQFAILLIPTEFMAIIPANAEAVFGLQQLAKDDKFVKHMGAITDMNGVCTIPVSQLNSLITGEQMGFQQKFDAQATAKADMPLVCAGNQFFKNSDRELPSQIRRFWQFILNTKPPESDVIVNNATILKAIPDYLRMVSEVYFETWELKLKSRNSKYRASTNPWVLASPYLKAVQMDTMTKVSIACKMIAAKDWIVYTGSETDCLSVDSLRYVSDIYQSFHAGNRTHSALLNRKQMIPNATKVEDAIALIYPYVTFERWGTVECKQRFGEESEQVLHGLQCQLGDKVSTENALYVLGLKICEDKLEMLVQLLPKNYVSDMPPPSEPVPQLLHDSHHTAPLATRQRPVAGAKKATSAPRKMPSRVAPVTSRPDADPNTTKTAQIPDLSDLMMDMMDTDE